MVDIRSGAVVAAAVALLGCAHANDPVANFNKAALTRASQELNCPAEKLTVVKYSGYNRAAAVFSFGMTPGTGAAVGVSGCGRRATYTNDSTGYGWNMQGIVQTITP